MNASHHPSGEPATAPARGFSPVLSLTVLDASTMPGGRVCHESRMLVVVRRPECNPTHPNVVSVPTQRVPAALFGDLVAYGAASPATGGDGGSDSNLHSGHDSLIYATEALLARKLGIGDALERSELSFSAALTSRVPGHAVYDDGEAPGTSEPIDMLNVVVKIAPGDIELPAESASYSYILWATVQSFLDALEQRDPSTIDPRLDPLKLCLHGLCLSAAETSLKSLLRSDPSARPLVASCNAA